MTHNVHGLARVGLLPDMIADMKNVGLSNADLDPLFSSAEAYIQMWERARGEIVRSGCDACTIGDTELATITCPTDVVALECDVSSDASSTGSATAADNCAENPMFSSSDVETAGAYAQEKTITRT